MTDDERPQERGETQFEQENFLGRGGGEVDDATMKKARREAERRLRPDECEGDAPDG